MSKHSPGPWYVHSVTEVRYHSKTGEKIVETRHWISLSENSNEPLALICHASLNADKDARLIATAPKLKAALDKAYLQILEFLNEGKFDRAVEWDAGYIVDALAEANGES